MRLGAWDKGVIEEKQKQMLTQQKKFLNTITTTNSYQSEAKLLNKIMVKEYRHKLINKNNLSSNN